MIITLIPTDVLANPIPLAPGVEARLADMAADVRVNGTRIVQSVALFRAPATKQFSRLNRTTSLAFRVTRLHATRLAAMTFAFTHETALGAAEGAVRVRDTFAAVTGFVIQNAVVNSADTQQIGLTTITNYQITGGAVVSY